MSTAALPRFTTPHLADPSRRSPAGLLAIGALHLAALWLFLQTDVVHRAVQQATPQMVALLSEPVRPPAPVPPPVPAPQRQALPAPVWMPPPDVRVVADAPPAPPPAPVVVSTAPAPALAQATAPVAPPPAVAAAADPLAVRPAPAAPPAPPVLPASAIRYRVQPPVEVPLASRRVRESGTVLLRVLVDTQGLPRQITLHKSSGFARLDDQALAAMRQARFQAVNDNGSAIEWVVIAPLQYDID